MADDRGHGITPEQIAREAAEAAVVPYFRGGTPYDSADRGVSVGGIEVPCRRDEDLHAIAFRKALEPLVLAAVERALREAPIPGGLSAERVAEIDAAHRAAASRSQAGVVAEVIGKVIGDLLADNAHLRRALHDCGQDGSAKVWAGGYEAGYEARGEARDRERERMAEALARIRRLAAGSGADLATAIWTEANAALPEG